VNGAFSISAGNMNNESKSTESELLHMVIPKVFGQFSGLGKMGQAVKAGAESFSKEWSAGYNAMSQEEKDLMWGGMAATGATMAGYKALKDD
jgi:hypothetical protein